MTVEPAVKTTVVLAVWDDYVSEWLEEAVADLRAQDAATSIVVVDNASVVPLPAFPDVSVARSPRRLTRGAARDLGLAAVSTPYVVMWDVDDVMPPGTLSFLEASISSDPRLAVFATAIVELPSGVRHRWPRRWVAGLVRVPALFALLNCVWSLYPTNGGTIMRTELARSAGGYGDAESGEDWFLGVSLAFRGRVGWSERPGRAYRLHDQSNWARHATNVRYQLAHARAVRNRIRADAGLPAWLHTLLPLIALGQYAAIAVHVAATRLRLIRRAGAR